MYVPKFWIVWSPSGSSPPTRRHESEMSARDEAERLAATAAGAEFFVCEVTGMAKVAAVEWSYALYPRVVVPDVPDVPKTPATDDADLPF